MRYTLGAGGLSVFLVLLLILTGTLEMFFYVPTPEQAGPSIQALTFLTPFGGLVRSLHYWAAQLLVAVVVVHLARVVLTGAYAQPRRFNYLLGLALLVLVLLLDFTGYALRWDEGVRWALVAGTNLLRSIPFIGNGIYRLVVGDDQLGSAALLRFYAWHVFGLTLPLVFISAWHLFRVRRDGGIAAPSPMQRDSRERVSRDVLVQREVIVMLVGGALLFALAAFVPPPLAPPLSEASLQAADSRAPWFFLWVQELLRYGDPFLLGVALPLTLALFLGLIPYVLPSAQEAELGRWFPRGNRAAQGALLIVALFVFALSLVGILR